MSAARPISALGTLIAVVNLGYCICLAEFEMFPGFDVYDKENATTFLPDLTKTTVLVTDADQVVNSKETAVTKKTKSGTKPAAKYKSTTLSTLNNKVKTTTVLPLKMTMKPFKCPEEERPSNIGSYEVPTQRDLVKHMKLKLLRMFNSYHAKALYFLKDIKEATRATSEIAHKCPSNARDIYRRCVRHVGNQSQVITKSVVTSLEYQRHDVAALTEGPICNLTSMRADPVQLIKNLAMEEASLEFALPGFLRLLSACSFYCNISATGDKRRLKPSRHMTDQDLVIKHFLTRKNYVQLIKGTQ